MFVTRWPVIFWLKSNKSKSEKDLGGRNSNYIWLAGVYSYSSRSKHRDPCCPSPSFVLFSLTCCSPDLSWCIRFTQSQFHDSLDLFLLQNSTFISYWVFCSQSSSFPAPTSVLALYTPVIIFKHLHWSNVNAIILRGVFPPAPKYEELYNLGALTILKMVLHCGFKDKTDAKLQIMNESKVKWKVELISFGKLRALALA